MKPTVLLSVVFLACTARGADTGAIPPADLAGQVAAIDSAIEHHRERLRVPGAAVALVRHDSLLLSKGYGLRDKAAGLPVTPRTLFAIGSCTKPFTALASMISADSGLLTLNDPPTRFLPYFQLRDAAANQQVTLRDLLSNRTGVPDDLAAGWYEKYGTRERLIRAAMQAKPKGKFREAFNYNNYMFLAAGEAIAVAHGTSYENVIARTIFEPLGMRHSSLSLDSMEASSDFAYGYEDEGRTRVAPKRLVYNTAMAPAANINSNAEDMAQWIRLLANGGMFDGKRLVSDSAFKEMLTPAVRTGGGHYALGWFVEDWHGLRLYSHPGGVAGYGTRCEFLPDQRLGWVVLTNVDDQQLPKAIREAIYANLLPNSDNRAR
ncbi:MAG TPA: serine hydrolase domain-containing protein [Gemmatimonadaceae bacterium]|nr:serine hydrolase domain-containing protein [Gemmatimonadaceae bacterium]